MVSEDQDKNLPENWHPHLQPEDLGTWGPGGQGGLGAMHRYDRKKEIPGIGKLQGIICCFHQD